MKYIFLWIALFCVFQGNAQNTFSQQPTTDAANAFLTAFSPEMRSIAQLSFSDTSRTKWSNLPNLQYSRKGAWLKDLNDDQKQRLHAILRTVLSQQGYQKILFIMQYDEAALERLKAANNPIAARYSNKNYWFTIFGEPKVGNIWSFKLEGHHISLNFTFSPKGVTCTPLFTGINPALITSGDYAGRHLMYEEDAFGKALFSSLSPVLKAKARIAEHPKDADVMVQKGNEAFLTQKQGIAYTSLNAAQKEMVAGIIEAWVKNVAPAIANEKMKRIEHSLKNAYFVWMGSEDASQLHYYRLQSPAFVIEFTNRDGGIYHYHTMWRDVEEDFKY
jgi:Protein of unknown function (DUF3500)